MTQEDVVRTKEITKEKKPSMCEGQKKETKENTAYPLLLVRGCHGGWRGQEQWWFLPSTQFSHGTHLLRLRLSSFSSSSRHSRSSHSDA